MNNYPDDELYQYILEVTQKDIDNGEAANHLMCPITLSFHEHRENQDLELNNEEWDKRPLLKPHVWTNNTSLINQQGKRDSYQHSEGIAKWIRAHDNNKHVKPISIIVDPIFFRMKLLEEGSDVERRWHNDDRRIS